MVAFRKSSPKALLIGAGICFTFMLARENRDFYQSKKIIHKGEAVAAIDTTTTKLTEQQKEELGAMKDFKERYTPEKKVKRMEKSIRQVTGSYQEVYDFRTNSYVEDLVRYLYFGLWDVLLFMFIGMAFFKMGTLLALIFTKCSFNFSLNLSRIFSALLLFARPLFPHL